MSSSRTLGHFVWQDCLTANIDEALSYFEKLVSWRVLDQTWPNIGRYPIVQSEAGAVAGVLEMPKFLQNSGVPSVLSRQHKVNTVLQCTFWLESLR